MLGIIAPMLVDILFAETLGEACGEVGIPQVFPQVFEPTDILGGGVEIEAFVARIADIERRHEQPEGAKPYGGTDQRIPAVEFLRVPIRIHRRSGAPPERGANGLTTSRRGAREPGSGGRRGRRVDRRTLRRERRYRIRP